MATQDKIQRTDKTVTSNIEASPTLLSILPLILAAKNGTLLTYEEKKDLRLTCRAAKAAVDPYISSFLIDPDDMSDVGFEAFRHSSLFLTAKKLCCDSYFSRKDFMDIIRIPFNNLQNVSLRIDSPTLDLVPLCNWKNLKSLELILWWYSDRHPISDLNIAWESLSKAEWPVLESLAINIYIQIPVDDSDHDTYNYNEPLADTNMNVIKGSACLLSHFPKLKSLKIEPRMRLDDIEAFAAVPHSNLESVELSLHCEQGNDCEEVSALAEAKWPCLKELILHYYTSSENHTASENVVSNLVKAPWLLQLKKLKLAFEYDYCARHNAKNLIQGLQMGAIESLEIGICSPDVLLAFENVNLPKLKELEVSVRSRGYDMPWYIGEGLNFIFSTGNLPLLESLTVDCTDLSKDQLEATESWYHPPACAKQMEADPFSILPSLKFLYLRGIAISKDCAKFVFNGFYKRGCDVNLYFCSVGTDLDEKRLAEILSSFGIGDRTFRQELIDMGLFGKVFWFNLLSIGELHNIALSVYLSKFASDLECVIKPEVASMAARPEKGENSVSILVAERMQSATQKILKNINEVALHVDTVVGGSNGASGS